MGELNKFFGLAFSALLPLVNPLGDALVFLSLIGSAPRAVYRALARRIAISTTIFLIAIEAGGALVLKFFVFLCLLCRSPVPSRSRPWVGSY